MKKLMTLVALAFSLAALSACELEDACDRDQVKENGACVPVAVAAGGACGASDDGGQGGDSVDAEPNVGDTCECHEECLGGTLCGAPQLKECVALCGEGDAFEDGCPDGLSCVDFVQAFLCQ